MCIKNYPNNSNTEIFHQLLIGEIYSYDFLVYNKYIIEGLLFHNYIIPLETWRDQQINKILENE